MPTILSSLFFSVLKSENWVNKLPLLVFSISLTAKTLKSGLWFSLKSILISVSPLPGIRFEKYSDTTSALLLLNKKNIRSVFIKTLVYDLKIY